MYSSTSSGRHEIEVAASSSILPLVSMVLSSSLVPLAFGTAPSSMASALCKPCLWSGHSQLPPLPAMPDTHQLHQVNYQPGRVLL